MSNVYEEFKKAFLGVKYAAKISAEAFVSKVGQMSNEELQEIIQEAERQIRIPEPPVVFPGLDEAINPSHTGPDKHGTPGIAPGIDISHHGPSALMDKIRVDDPPVTYSPAWYKDEMGATGTIMPEGASATIMPEGARVVNEAKLTPIWDARYAPPDLSPYLQFAVGDDADLDLEDFNEPLDILRKLAATAFDPSNGCITCPISGYPIGMSYILGRWGNLIGNGS